MDNLRRFHVKKVIGRLCGSTSTSGLFGRDLIAPEHISKDNVLKLLWSAVDLKQKKPPPILESKHVTLIFCEPTLRMQVPFEIASATLGAKFTTYFAPDWGGANYDFDMTDNGRLVSCITDTVVVSGLSQQQTSQFSDGASVPIINARSGMFSLVRALSDLLTIYECLGPLRRRNLAWVGPPTGLCNTLLCLAPRVGLNLRFCIICSSGSGGMSAIKMDQGVAICKGQSEIHQFDSPNDAVYRADIIMTGKHNVASHAINQKAILANILSKYEPQIVKPDFEGPP